ncbi:hypothetical protein BC826DRAFT_96861 [Russula brevipes]|nr:hypothetical protein BC826DRAFT_96861 [Russula brevipes]
MYGSLSSISCPTTPTAHRQSQSFRHRVGDSHAFTNPHPHPRFAGVFFATLCGCASFILLYRLSNLGDHRSSSLPPNPRVRSAFGLVSSAGQMPHDDSARSEGFPKPKPTTSNAMARRIARTGAPSTRGRTSVPGATQYQLVSEQPYKSHSVPLTVVEQPEQDPANDLRGECVARAE